MARLRVAVVSRDPEVRMAAARAFQGAPADWMVCLVEEVPEGADVVVAGPGEASDSSAIRWDPAAPERVFREIEARRQKKTVISVTGLRGGAGATTLALHLGYGLSACVVDLSAEAYAARRLGISDPRLFAPGDDPHSASLPVAPGIRLLLAPGRPEAVGDAAAAFGRVIVDHPGSRVEQPHARIMILPPSLPAAVRAGELLAGYDEPCALVVNRVGPGGSSTRVALERRLGRRITLMLPCTPALRDAEDEGRLVTGLHVRWWRGVRRLAAAVEKL